MLLQGWIHTQRNNTDGLSQYEMLLTCTSISYKFHVSRSVLLVLNCQFMQTSEIFHMLQQILTNVLMEVIPAHPMPSVRIQLAAIPANVLIRASKEMVMNAQVL